MRRRLFALAAALALAAAAAHAQPTAATAITATLVGPAPETGLGVTLPVRLADAATDAPLVQARISAVRLVSPFGAVMPVQPPPEGAASLGVRAFRADLPSPGAWLLEFTVAAPGLPAARESVDVTVAASTAVAPSPDPLGTSAVAAGPDGPALAPGAALPGPGGVDAVATPAPATAGRAAAAASAAGEPTTPFCAECAAQAPH